ncbi:MAG: GNAT family N-acetyltransferase [Gemmataceae bacterium]
MEIRTYQPGDEAAQVSIYNEAAGELPKFKAATLDEVRRRVHAADYDPTTRFLALVDGRPVGYASFQMNGRISHPWCRKGYEAAAKPLFERVLQTMKARGLNRAFTAYRADWPAQQQFFHNNGFQLRREMVNYVLDLVEMPTPMARPSSSISAATPDDVAALLDMGGNVLLMHDRAALEQYLFHNPYFSAVSVFALRQRTGGAALAFGVVIANADYADPRQVDAAMPCFRLGAFGSEGMSCKRINGLFSFISGDRRDAHPLALDLLGYAAHKLRDTEVETFAAQAPSDAGHLPRFYEQYFQRQASFPILERSLQK